MNFSIGQKVVFVGGSKLPGERWIKNRDRLRKGEIYTIREFEELYLPYFGMVGIRVAESIYGSVLWHGRYFQPCDLAYNFRPVVVRNTDISVFTAMLNIKSRELRAV